MSETSEEWEEVVACDGNTYRVLKGPYKFPPKLPVSESERLVIDAAIDRMATVARRRGIQTNTPRRLNENKEVCQRIDELVAEALISIRSKVKEDTAEKFFEILMDAADKREDPDEAWSLGLISIRFLDTMNYFVSYKKRFRGEERKSVMYSKDEAFRVLRERGLTKR